jgi:pilus assembly protein CpaC
MLQLALDNKRLSIQAIRNSWFLVISAWILLILPATAQTGQSSKPQVSEVPQLTVIASKSIIVNTAEPIERVAVTSTEIADALVISPQQVMINGKTPGIVSLILWDKNGKSTSYDLVVEIDLSLLQRQLEEQFPTENINVSSAKGAVVLSGSASDPRVVEKAIEISGSFSAKVINLLQLPPPPDTEQILLMVKFADVDRSASQQLGVNIFSTGAGHTIGSIGTEQFGGPLNNSSITPGGGLSNLLLQDALNIFALNKDINLGVTIKALQAKNLLQILAEPNLMASNGREASFLAGGEFPFPVVQGGANINTVTIQFKEFGVRLNFTPTVTSSGKIRLKVKPEVSALDFNNAVNIGGFLVPALSTRRAETEVELADGQSFAIAGLLDNRVTEIANKIPGLGDLPIIGYLFKSRDIKKAKTELVVLVTPKFVKPLNPDQVPPVPEMPKPFLDEYKFDGKVGAADKQSSKASPDSGTANPK